MQNTNTIPNAPVVTAFSVNKGVCTMTVQGVSIAGTPLYDAWINSPDAASTRPYLWLNIGTSVPVGSRWVLCNVAANTSYNGTILSTHQPTLKVSMAANEPLYGTFTLTITNASNVPLNTLAVPTTGGGLVIVVDVIGDEEIPFDPKQRIMAVKADAHVATKTKH